MPFLDVLAFTVVAVVLVLALVAIAKEVINSDIPVTGWLTIIVVCTVLVLAFSRVTQLIIIQNGG